VLPEWAVASLEAYKAMKNKNPEFNTIDFQGFAVSKNFSREEIHKTFM